MTKTWWGRVRRLVARDRYERHEQVHASVDRAAGESLDRAKRGIRRNPFH
jgi:hypothetical protein